MIHLAPIQVASLQTHDKHFRTAQIGGNGHIMLVAMADGLDHLVVIPGVGIIGIGKQQHQVDLIVGNTGIDLLMAALFMGKQQSDRQTRMVSNQTAGGGSSKQIMLAQHTFIGGTKLHHQFFFLIMCQKRDVHCIHSFYSKGIPAHAVPGYAVRCGGTRQPRLFLYTSEAAAQRPRQEPRRDPPGRFQAAAARYYP